jgi:hypothetical protein
MRENKSSNQFTVKWTEEDKPLREDFEKEKEKQKSNMKAFRVKLKENIDMKIAISELQKENEKLRAFEIYAKDQISGKGEESTEISEKPCSFMVYVKNQPNCADPNAPIDSYLKRHLNPQICALCQKLKREKENAVHKKEDEDQQKALEKAKAETRRYAERLKEPLRKRDEFAGSPRVNWDSGAPNGAVIW